MKTQSIPLMSNNPLVSICVITYNSSDFILATLNSIKEQSYLNIELIISDDCSTDDTTDICNTWLKNNKQRFVFSIVSTLPRNCGVSKNCNNAISKCNGEWLMLLAGDDLLTPNAITDYIEFINCNPGNSIVFSQYQYFREKGSAIVKGSIRPNGEELDIFKKDANSQLRELQYTNYLPAPSYIIQTSLSKEHPFDESYRMCEDYPYWLTLSLLGIRFTIMERITILYRQHESISHSNKKYVNEKLLLENEKLFFNIIYPRCETDENLLKYKRAVFFIQEFEVILLKNNKSNLLGRLIMKSIRRIVSKWAGQIVPF